MADNRDQGRGQSGRGGQGRSGGKNSGDRRRDQGKGKGWKDSGGSRGRDRGKGNFGGAGRGTQGGKGRAGGFKGKSKAHTREYRSVDPNEPLIPAGVSAEDLDEDALRALKTLSGANQEIVARHLVAAGQLIDIDPELSYQHAQAAVKRAGRVDVVREAAALTAYASGRYEEALREVRAVRRMRGDESLRAIEADCERGLGRFERAIEIVEETDTGQLPLEEQVELMLVAAGARADLDQLEYSLMIVDNALASLPEDVPSETLRRLITLRIERLEDLGRADQAEEAKALLPPEEDPMEIVDVGAMLIADVDNVRTDLRGGEQPLNKQFDAALLDLDGVCYSGTAVTQGGPEALEAAEDAGMQVGYLTNNSSRSPQTVADLLSDMGYAAESNQVMTSAMDLMGDLTETLPEGAKVLVTGSPQLRQMVEDTGFTVVDSADDSPVAVVQGLGPDLGWKDLSEAALAIERGATHYATNIDPKLPTERGFAVGNGSMVFAVSNATGKEPIAAGKPRAQIFERSASSLRVERPIVVGDQLSTDIEGAVNAKMPSMHVLTGVSDARDVVLARRGQRPAYVAMDISGLNEVHPRPRHHKDGTWTCGVSQPVLIDRRGRVSIGGVELAGNGGPVTLNLDTYRALIAASWEVDESRVRVLCPELVVVTNEDDAGIVTEPNAVETLAEVEETGSEQAEGTGSEENPEETPEETANG